MACSALQWEKVKKAGIAPSPRTNFGLVIHKKRAFLFGGITDQHGRGDRMYSSMHNELFQMNLETQRWYPVAVKAPAKAKASSTAVTSKHATGATEQESGSHAAHSNSVHGDTSQRDAAEPDQATSSSRVDKQSAAAAEEAAGHKRTSSGSGGKLPGEAGAASDREADGAVQPDLANKLSDAGVDKNSALYKAAARIQSRFRGYTVRKVCLVP